MSRKYSIFLVSAFGLFGLLGYFAVEQVLPYTGIKPRRMVPAENAWRFPNGYTPEAFNLKAEKRTIQSPEGLHLSAWLVNSRLDTTYGTFVLLHGISNCKEVNFQRAAVLADSGYASLLLDLRAHGESEGEFCTFGFYEKADLKAVADSLTVWFPGRPIGIWGASLGGAVALQSMAFDPRYAFGIIESTFDEFPNVAREYGADYMLGLRSELIVNRVLKKSGAIAHFDPYKVKPVEAAAQINRPVLFMHGDRDSRIPQEFNKRNFEALQHPLKRWISVQNAGHTNLWARDSKHLEQEVSRFLRDCRNEEKTK